MRKTMYLKVYGRSAFHLATLLLLVGLSSPSRGMVELSKEFQDYMLQHHYGVVALDNSERVWNPQTMEAKINGERVTLGLHTCFQTTLTAACARRLGLTVADTGDPSVFVNRKLPENDGIALIKSFTMGDCEINRTSTIIVLPKTVHRDSSVDGFLGLDCLKLNAAIIPVGGTGFLIKPGPGPIVSVGKFLTQLGYKPFPLTATSKEMILECHINGRPVRMAIDTGAMFSLFDSATMLDIIGQGAAAMGQITPRDKTHPPKAFLFTPATFDLGGFDIHPMTMRAIESPELKKGAVEGFLGEDVLSLHRAIIDLGEDQLWLK